MRPKTPEETTLANIQVEAAGAHVEAAEANIAATEAARVLKENDTDRLADIQREATGAHVEAAEANVAATEAARVLRGADAERLDAILQVAALAHDDAGVVKANLDKSNRGRTRVGTLFVFVLLSLLGMTFYLSSVARENHTLNEQIVDCITAGSPCYEQAFGRDRAVREDLDKQLKANSGKLDEILARLPK